MVDFTIKDPIEVLEEIGQGTYGKVYHGRWKGSAVAIRVGDYGKRLSQSLSRSFDQTLVRDLTANRWLSHPNLLQYFGIAEFDGHPIVIMELMYESLDHRLRNGPTLPSMARLFIARSVACGLRYLHELPLPIIHRYLSSRAVMLSRDCPQVKIADVGSGGAVDIYLSAGRTIQHSARHYMPPESAGGGRDNNSHASFDMFSYGVLAIETISGRTPSPSPLLAPKRGCPGQFVVVNELERRRDDTFLLPQDYPLRSIFLQCLKEPPQRPTAARILDSFRMMNRHQSQKRTDAIDTEILRKSSSGGDVGGTSSGGDVGGTPSVSCVTPIVSHLRRFEILHKIEALEQRLNKQEECKGRQIVMTSRRLSLKILSCHFQMLSAKHTIQKYAEKLKKQVSVWHVAPRLSILDKNLPVATFQKELVTCSCNSGSINFQFIDITSWSVNRVVKYTANQLECHSCIAFEDRLIAVMWNTTTWKYRVTEYNPNDNLWSSTKQIDTKNEVSEVSVVCHEGQVFLVGGIDRRKQTISCVWRYDIASCVCESMPDMPTARYSCSCTIVDGSLCVAGGRLHNGRASNQFDIMNLHSREWQKLPPTGNNNPSLGQVGNMPLAVGGRKNKHKLSNDVEVYDVVLQQWLPLPSIGVPREGSTIFELEQGMVVVVGGCANEKANTAEVMNLRDLIETDSVGEHSILD